MTYKEELKMKLIQHPTFRERRFRGKGLMILSLRHQKLEEVQLQGSLTIENLIDLAGTYDSYRHEFDAVQRECPELRGEDYDDKTKVVQEKLLEFGYEPGYQNDIKQNSLPV